MFQNRLGLIAGRKFTVSALFYFVFEGNFQVQTPGAYTWRGDLKEVFLRHEFNWGACIWRGLFLEFYSILSEKIFKPV